MAPSSKSPFISFCAGKVSGAPEMKPWSLPKAMKLPENVTPPINTPAMMLISASKPASPVVPPAVSRQNSAAATKADAPPPKPLNIPTICGIEVILMARAATAPIPEPTAMPMRICV